MVGRVAFFVAGPIGIGAALGGRSAAGAMVGLAIRGDKQRGLYGEAAVDSEGYMVDVDFISPLT